jgi:hypothetical protein
VRGTMFREAVFNGLGQLLPRYASQVPSMNVNSVITNQGVMGGGQPISPAKTSSTAQATAQENHYHTHIDTPTEVADPVLLGNAIAWRLQNDPNSR